MEPKGNTDLELVLGMSCTHLKCASPEVTNQPRHINDFLRPRRRIQLATRAGPRPLPRSSMMLNTPKTSQSAWNSERRISAQRLLCIEGLDIRSSRDSERSGICRGNLTCALFGNLVPPALFTLANSDFKNLDTGPGRAVFFALYAQKTGQEDFDA